MALSLPPLRQRIVLVGLLLAACGREVRDNSHFRATPEQLASEARFAEQERMRREALDAQNAERERLALAIENDPPELLSEQQLHQLLDYHCGDCHFYTGGEWGGVYFNSLAGMLEWHVVFAGDAEGSPLIVYMRMHRSALPDGAPPPPPEVAIELVADFINQLPHPDAGAGNP